MDVQKLINLEYINIQEIPELKSIIQQYRLHIQINYFRLKEIQELGHVRDRNRAENEAVTNKMFAMEKQNIIKNKHYQAKIQQSIKRHELTKAEIIEQHERIMKNAQTKQIQATQNLDLELAKLRDQYIKMQQLQLQQQQFLAEIKHKSATLISQQYEHHDNMNKQEEREVQENRALFKKNRDLIKELKRDVKMEAGRIVYQEKYQNEDKNYQLKVKLFDLQQQVSKIRKQRNQIVKSRNEQKINVSLNEEEIQQYKAVGSIQKSKIKIYTDKVESLKKAIGSQLSKLQTKIKEKKTRWENELKGSKLKLFNLQKLRQQLKINLQRYKLLGQTILMQRSQVQQFFLMAIQSCKKQINEFETVGMSESQKQYGERVDIDQLLPKDKHRIITNLYTKLALAPTR